MTDDDIIDGIIRAEGSTFTNDPTDRGSATKFGITQATLSDFLGRPATVEEVQNMAEDTARAIYQRKYITTPGFGRIVDDQVRAAAIDWGVNSGPATAIRSLQSIVGVTIDGVLGPATATAINSTSQTKLLLALSKARAVYVAAICERDPSQVRFIKGWTTRIWSFLGV
jgi:lysozyme family protein